MGLARWLTATMLTLSATTGIVLAMKLTGVWGWSAMKELVLLALWDAFWSAIPLRGFAMLFSVPPRFLKYCALVGALAHSMRMVLVHYGMPIEWATLAASSFVSLVFVYLSRRLPGATVDLYRHMHHSYDSG